MEGMKKQHSTRCCEICGKPHTDIQVYGQHPADNKAYHVECLLWKIGFREPVVPEDRRALDAEPPPYYVPQTFSPWPIVAT